LVLKAFVLVGCESFLWGLVSQKLGLGHLCHVYPVAHVCLMPARHRLCIHKTTLYGILRPRLSYIGASLESFALPRSIYLLISACQANLFVHLVYEDLSLL
jgi:hypothetical protein